MKVLNIHSREINAPKAQVVALLDTIATPNDQMWPFEKWPAMKFREGVKVDSKGGHGVIRYRIKRYIPRELIEFEFRKPKGFNGVHRFDFFELGENKTEVRHTIDMDAVGVGIVTWSILVKWLHNALLEDALHKIENQFRSSPKKTTYNLWVRFLRKIFGTILVPS